MQTFALCNLLQSANSEDSTPAILSNAGEDERLRIAYHENLSDLELEWLQLPQVENLWLSPAISRVMALVLPEDVLTGYFSIKKGNLKCVVPVYVMSFSLNRQLSQSLSVQKLFSGLIRVRILLVGQFMSTGNHIPIPWEDAEITSGFLEMVQRTADALGTKAILLKDFYHKVPILEQKGYFPFTYQPDMVMPISSDWKHFGHYEEALSSKYRVRMHRAQRKMEGMAWADLDLELISKWENRIFELYDAVLSGAGFHLGKINPGYFVEMKLHFADNFRITGGFLHGQLVCFFASLRNGNSLEINLAGFDKILNGKKQLYLNMLFLMVREAIKRGVSQIHFYRTAMEIKSSVGAIGRDCHIYLKPVNAWLAPLFPIFVPWFSPKNPMWVPRSPFKFH